MRIAGLGTLALGPYETYTSEPIAVPYFNGTKLTFEIDEDVANDGHLDDFSAAAKRFLELTRHDREHAAPYLFKNYSNVRAAVGDDQIGDIIASPTDIWKHVRVGGIRLVRRKRRDRKVYLVISAECSWEPEHGLQIVYREGHALSRVSAFDGHLTYTDARDLPEDEDRII